MMTIARPWRVVIRPAAAGTIFVCVKSNVIFPGFLSTR